MEENREAVFAAKKTEDTRVDLFGCGEKIAVIASPVPDKKRCAAFLLKEFGAGTDILLMNGVEFAADRCRIFKTEMSEEILMQRFIGADELIMVTPTLGVLYALAQGEEADALLTAALRALLWGIKMTIVLDFEPPRFSKGTFYARVADTMNELKSMGIQIAVYRNGKKEEQYAKHSLITEADVLEIKKQGKNRIACTKNVIITPLAKDTMKELGIREEM